MTKPRPTADTSNESEIANAQLDSHTCFRGFNAGSGCAQNLTPAS